MGLEINPIEEMPHIQPGLFVSAAGVGKRPCIYDDSVACHAPQKLCMETCKSCVRAFQVAPKTREPVSHIFNFVKSLAISLMEFMGV